MNFKNLHDIKEISKLKIEFTKVNSSKKIQYSNSNNPIDYLLSFPYIGKW
jgi:hypothetical protein